MWRFSLPILSLALTLCPLQAASVQQNVFHRGDADGNGAMQLTDSIRILGWQFLGGVAPPCLDAAHANDSGVIDLSDPIFILNFLFLGGPGSPSPG